MNKRKEKFSRFAYMGEALRIHRNKRTLFRHQLSERSYVSIRYLQSIELGKANPTLPLITEICQALGINPIELLAEYFKPEMEEYINNHPKVKEAEQIIKQAKKRKVVVFVPRP